jgi:nitrite reductase/ring-hydroxylating ferredoxin subunit
MSEKDLQRSIEALLGDRRPPGRSLTRDELAALRAAARLRAAHPGASTPSPEFVDALARRLRERPAGTGRTRRSFLRGAGLAAAAAVVGVAGDRVVSAVTGEHPREAHQDGELVPWSARWTPVTTLAALQSKPVVRFTAGAVAGFVVRAGTTITAMSAVCTHQGCILDAAADMSRLVCPCHEQTFALDGRPNPGDYYLTPLPRIRSRVNGDAVEVLV